MIKTSRERCFAYSLHDANELKKIKNEKNITNHTLRNPLGHMSWAQRHSEKITKELTFEKKSEANALMISNINGDIKVEGYSGDKILVEVEKIIIGKTEARLEKGKARNSTGHQRPGRYTNSLYGGIVYSV